MSFKLKALKIVQICPNGCVYFNCSSYLKTFKKIHFLERNLVYRDSKPPLFLTQSNSFYMKYRSQI